ncbi:GntR family transcriptional regulator [Pseudonocardia sp. CA-107938]|uniref:GntR family transcriptional regulator n=1 Tax=Pseudonocardia sp. CA-107938 TaxID=3240021 RepID=UPI003D90104F
MPSPYRPRRTLPPDTAGFLERLRPRDRADLLDELRRVVLAGDAPPGVAVPAEEVAALFGVSVIPVREALKTLVGEGLVEHRPRGGYTVARLTPAELHELYVVRGVLEQAALGAAVAAAQPVDHDRAAAAHEAMHQALRDGDERAHHRESRRFHLALVAPSGMRRLQAMLESAWNLTEPYRPMSQVPEPERAALHAEHERMLAAFTAGAAAELLATAAAHHEHLVRAVDSSFREGDPECASS